jgi:hypothetical protein
MKQTTQQSAELTSVNPPEERAPVSTETKIPNASLNTESERSESVGGFAKKCDPRTLVRIWTDNPNMLSLITVFGLPAGSSEQPSGLYQGNSATVTITSDQMTALRAVLGIETGAFTSITYDPQIPYDTNCKEFKYGNWKVQLFT